MKIPIYQVDAFTSTLLAGNPAAVCVLQAWLDDRVLQDIAAENNLSETAFIVRRGDGYELRWFTPTIEVALCGHATLAAAFVVFNRLGWAGSSIPFASRQSGILEVAREGDMLTLNFPARPFSPIDTPVGLAAALNATPREVLGSTEDLLVVLDDEKAVRGAQPDFAAIAKLPCRGVIVTSRGRECDFVSRFFAPAAGIPEDPVTGSAHCVLAPYWAGVLGKSDLYARQVSRRGGELWCRVAGDRVFISGRAVLYLEGTIECR
jgi:PhzF family phenazine biosynthesis protein